MKKELSAQYLLSNMDAEQLLSLCHSLYSDKINDWKNRGISELYKLAANEFKANTGIDYEASYHVKMN